MICNDFVHTFLMDVIVNPKKETDQRGVGQLRCVCITDILIRMILMISKFTIQCIIMIQKKKLLFHSGLEMFLTSS